MKRAAPGVVNGTEKKSATTHKLATFAARERYSRCNSLPLSQELALSLEQNLCD